jgi:phage FluMu gp28-like protein
MLFTPYLFQEKLLYLLNKHDRTLILKSRQLGITTLTAAYALWLMLFKKDQSILALAPTQEKARNIVDKVRFAYSQLPSWLKIASLEDNKLSLILENGSKIKAASGASESARGYTANVLILDEAAFIENAEDLWGSAQQTLATGGRAIVLSTPNGIGQWFHQQWVGAESEENNFIPVRLPWSVHPSRNQKWRDDQDKD